MSFFKSLMKAFTGQPAPKLWDGELIEVPLTPAGGYQVERAKAAEGSGAKVVWVKLGRTPGKDPQIVVQSVKTGDILGKVPKGNTHRFESVFDQGIETATCFITDDDPWAARLRVGESKYMPKPYWK